jgi:trehalose 6-phosphate synthase
MKKFQYSDIGLVTPLIDGQNLVAKEYLAVQDPHDPGILILSKKAGAAAELSDLGVLCVDPYDISEIADKINEALTTPRLQRIDQHQRIMSHLYQFDIGHWAESFLDNLSQARYPLTDDEKKTFFMTQDFHKVMNVYKKLSRRSERQFL